MTWSPPPAAQPAPDQPPDGAAARAAPDPRSPAAAPPTLPWQAGARPGAAAPAGAGATTPGFPTGAGGPTTTPPAGLPTTAPPAGLPTPGAAGAGAPPGLAAGAEAATAGAGWAVADRAARPVPATRAPHDRPTGTVWRSERALRHSRRRALSYRLAPLHVGWHLVTPATLRQLSAGTPGTGLIMGIDEQRRPVPVRLFRPVPTRLTLVAGVWLQRLLVFRALALGARVLLMTTDPSAWQGFGEWATGAADRVTVWTENRPPVLTATAEQPVLVVHDMGTFGAAPLPAPGAWQAELVVLRQLNADTMRALQDCDLVVMQRLTDAEAGVAASALGLTDRNARLLEALEPDMLALLDGGPTTYVWLAPTQIERRYHGAPRR